MSFFKKLFGGRKAPVLMASNLLEPKYNFGKNVLENTDPEFDLLTDIVDYLHARFENKGWEQSEVFDHVPTWYRHVYLAWVLNGEVLNGGVLQYFSNSSGESSRDMLDAFSEMGSDRLYKFMEAAIEAHNGLEKLEKLEKSKPSDAETDKFIEENHDLLDNQYYEGLEDVLYETVDDYMKQKMKLSGEVSFVIP